MLPKILQTKKALFVTLLIAAALFASQQLLLQPNIKNVEYGKPNEISPNMHDTLTQRIIQNTNPLLTAKIKSSFIDGYISTDEYIAIAQQQIVLKDPLRSSKQINYSTRKAKADLTSALNAL